MALALPPVDVQTTGASPTQDELIAPAAVNRQNSGSSAEPIASTSTSQTSSAASSFTAQNMEDKLGSMKTWKRLPLNKPPKEEGNGPVCSNCTTNTTPLWRRSESGDVLCNACSLYQKMKGCPRPISLKTDVIKHRNRSKGSKKEKAKAIPYESDNTSPNNRPADRSRGDSTSRTREEVGQKSMPGGSADEFAPDSRGFDASAKRRKRESPDYEWHPFLGQMSAKEIMDRQAQLHNRQAAARGNGSRSSSVDTYANSRSASVGHPSALGERSPSQPGFPSHRMPMYPPYHAPFNFFPRSAADPFGKQWPTPASDMPTSQHPGITLPPIRMAFDEQPDSKERGRQRERIYLPPIQSQPSTPHHANTFPAAQGYYDAQSSRSSSNAATVMASPPFKGLSMPMMGQEHSFPQSDSRDRRPSSSVSDEVSSGSNAALQSPRSTASNTVHTMLENATIDGESEPPTREMSSADTPESSVVADSTELNQLRMRVAELELINSLLSSRVNELEKKQDTPQPMDEA